MTAASGSDTFDAAWEAFLAAGQTVANVRRDFSEWHRGRPRYCLWALEMADRDVGVAVAAAQAHLAGHLLAGYERQPHVTLALCGFPVGENLRLEDEFTAEDFDFWARGLVADAPSPFQVEIGALASFSSAPFFRVADPERGVARLRRLLAGWAGHDGGGSYVPHLTVGLYGGSWPVAPMARCLSGYAGPVPGLCKVERVSLLSYEAAVIGGPLRREASFDLATRQLDGAPPWPSR
ncbi:MAG: 2'-5' RNA ligase family protein [Zoogloeaceae bacterium]|nr:2'-5' RNA ligase family protein [Zoogloeaceae bacterium]